MEDQIIPAGETLYKIPLSFSGCEWPLKPDHFLDFRGGFFYFPFRCIPSFFFFFFVHKRVSTSFVLRLSLWRAGRHSPRISSLRFFFSADSVSMFFVFFLILYVTWWKPVSLDRPLNGGPTYTITTQPRTDEASKHARETYTKSGTALQLLYSV